MDTANWIDLAHPDRHQPPAWATGWWADLATVDTADPAQALGLARRHAGAAPLPGGGATRELWGLLASLGAVDLTLARAVEPHLDALAILAEERGIPADDAATRTWGVYAAERPDARLAYDDGRLTGLKPWCSLAGLVDRALVTAWVDDERRGLFAVDLRDPGVRVRDDPWEARGLRAIRSGAIELDAVPAAPVGGPGWYLDRDGFAWGGMGVAAVWFGGAVGLARRLALGLRRRPPDQLALAYAGRVDAALWAAGAVLADAAARIDAGTAGGAGGEVLALRVRQVVADACELTLTTVGHALGPAPLTGEAEHAARVADLQVYLRQHHAARDEARLGELAVAP